MLDFRVFTALPFVKHCGCRLGVWIWKSPVTEVEITTSKKTIHVRTNPGRQATRLTTFFTVAPDICGYAWNVEVAF